MFAALRAARRDIELLAILSTSGNSRTPMQWDNGKNAGFTGAAVDKPVR